MTVTDTNAVTHYDVAVIAALQAIRDKYAGCKVISKQVRKHKEYSYEAPPYSYNKELHKVYSAPLNPIAQPNVFLAADPRREHYTYTEYLEQIANLRAFKLVTDFGDHEFEVVYTKPAKDIPRKYHELTRDFVKIWDTYLVDDCNVIHIDEVTPDIPDARDRSQTPLVAPKMYEAYWDNKDYQFEFTDSQDHLININGSVDIWRESNKLGLVSRIVDHVWTPYSEPKCIDPFRRFNHYSDNNMHKGKHTGKLLYTQTAFPQSHYPKKVYDTKKEDSALGYCVDSELQEIRRFDRGRCYIVDSRPEHICLIYDNDSRLIHPVHHKVYRMGCDISKLKQKLTKYDEATGEPPYHHYVQESTKWSAKTPITSEDTVGNKNKINYSFPGQVRVKATNGGMHQSYNIQTELMIINEFNAKHKHQEYEYSLKYYIGPCQIWNNNRWTKADCSNCKSPKDQTGDDCHTRDETVSGFKGSHLKLEFKDNCRLKCALPLHIPRSKYQRVTGVFPSAKPSEIDKIEDEILEDDKKDIPTHDDDIKLSDDVLKEYTDNKPVSNTTYYKDAKLRHRDHKIRMFEVTWKITRVIDLLLSGQDTFYSLVFAQDVPLPKLQGMDGLLIVPKDFEVTSDVPTQIGVKPRYKKGDPPPGKPMTLYEQYQMLQLNANLPCLIQVYYQLYGMTLSKRQVKSSLKTNEAIQSKKYSMTKKDRTSVDAIKALFPPLTLKL